MGNLCGNLESLPQFRGSNYYCNGAGGSFWLVSYRYRQLLFEDRQNDFSIADDREDHAVCQH